MLFHSANSVTCMSVSIIILVGQNYFYYTTSRYDVYVAVPESSQV